MEGKVQMAVGLQLVAVRIIVRTAITVVVV